MDFRAILRRASARPEMQGIQPAFPTTASCRLQDRGQKRRPLPQDAGGQRSDCRSECDDESLRTASETSGPVASALCADSFEPQARSYKLGLRRHDAALKSRTCPRADSPSSKCEAETGKS